MAFEALYGKNIIKKKNMHSLLFNFETLRFEDKAAGNHYARLFVYICSF